MNYWNEERVLFHVAVWLVVGLISTCIWLFA